MRRLAVAAFLLTALLLAPRADAANLGRDYRTATHYWGTAPTCTVELQPVAHIDGGIGQAEYGEPCHIRIVRTLREPDGCAVMVHEVGHLLGLEHSTDPRNVMYDGPRLFIPRICRGKS